MQYKGRKPAQLPTDFDALYARYQCRELRQHRTIPALRLKHRSGSCGTASALPKYQKKLLHRESQVRQLFA